MMNPDKRDVDKKKPQPVKLGRGSEWDD